MEITGKILEVPLPKTGKTQEGKVWQSQPLLIETLDEKFPKKVYVEFYGQDKIDKAMPLIGIGKTVVISFDLESHEFNNKWYTYVRAWKIDRPEDEVAAEQPQPSDPFDSIF